MSEAANETASAAEEVRRHRASAAKRARELGRADLADDVALVVSELATNAVLHGGGVTDVRVDAIDGGLRVEVRDTSRLPPLMGLASDETLTGRGVRLVAALARRWGAEPDSAGKVVWAELTGEHTAGPRPPGPPDKAEADALAKRWADRTQRSGERVRVELGDVPTDLLLAAKAHVDNVVREAALAATGAVSGMSGDMPPHLAELLTAVTERFAEARVAIKHQAIEAVNAGRRLTRLVLWLTPDAADAALEYLSALDELDTYSRAQRLLTLETPAQHRVFRRWYVDELVRQLRAAAAGDPVPFAQPFEQRLLDEIDRVDAAQRSALRAARLYDVMSALATAATPTAVADAVLEHGVAALGAAAGGVLLATSTSTLALPAAIGYTDDVVAQLRVEPRDAELPAAEALRTGEPVWLESRAERDRRFPQLAGLEADTVSLCAVPLEVDGRRLGAMRFSFHEARLFDDDERRFVMALASQTAQALDRTQLQRARLDASTRLQRSLLPTSLPRIAGADVAAMYHPCSDSMDVGGDFYDVWRLPDGTWGIAIGDASGTGPEAAALTARVRHSLRAAAMYDRDPSSLMAMLNSTLLDAAGPDDDRFCTAIFGVMAVDGATTSIDLASGGHPGPLVVRAGGTVEHVRLDGTLLGVFTEPHVARARVELAPGDTAILFTDGVIEARRGDDFLDVEGIEGVVARHAGDAAGAVAAIEACVLHHTGGALGDDMAVLAITAR